jgi:hypothetical protein
MADMDHWGRWGAQPAATTLMLFHTRAAGRGGASQGNHKRRRSVRRATWVAGQGPLTAVPWSAHPQALTGTRNRTNVERGPTSPIACPADGVASGVHPMCLWTAA